MSYAVDAGTGIVRTASGGQTYAPDGLTSTSQPHQYQHPGGEEIEDPSDFEPQTSGRHTSDTDVEKDETSESDEGEKGAP
ncbi:hypothetical protein LTS18_014749, partial [Coniosporium uncinatum]